METAAGRFRDKPLVITADRTVSFAEMQNLVEIVAGNLIAMDIRAGDREPSGWRTAGSGLPRISVFCDWVR